MPKNRGISSDSHHVLLMRFPLTRMASGSCQVCHRIQNHMAPLSSSAWNFWFLVIWGGCLYWGSMWGPPPALKHTETSTVSVEQNVIASGTHANHSMTNNDACSDKLGEFYIYILVVLRNVGYQSVFDLIPWSTMINSIEYKNVNHSPPWYYHLIL